MRQKLGDRQQLSLSAFDNHIDDLIDYVIIDFNTFEGAEPERRARAHQGRRARATSSRRSLARSRRAHAAGSARRNHRRTPAAPFTRIADARGEPRRGRARSGHGYRRLRRSQGFRVSGECHAGFLRAGERHGALSRHGRIHAAGPPRKRVRRGLHARARAIAPKAARTPLEYATASTDHPRDSSWAIA